MPAPSRPQVVIQPIVQSSVIAREEGEKPLIISPPNAERFGDFLTKFTEVIMFGIAMIAIWTGLIGIAFSDDATNYNYLILFIGGLISSMIALAMVEFSSKKNQYLLMPSQNYLLGISFFFMAVGLLWGIRFIAGWLTYDSPFNDFDLFGPAIPIEGDWVPNANLIYAQAAGSIALVITQQRLLRRYSGELTFSWTVTCFIPLALLLVGVGPWIDYSNNIISYELGTAIVCLSAIAMASAVYSNKSITFTIIASVCGIIPLIYELMNTNAPEDGVGGSISLLVFIIIIQGYLATNTRINQKLMERTSFILIGVIVLSMFVSSVVDANAILGPLRMSDTAFASTLTLPVILWFVTLAAFFPAVLNNRVPAMPIGLAFALWTLNGDEAILPWIVAVIMVTYMMFFAKVTRKWVANLTISALSISYLLSDLIGYGIDNELINLGIALSIIAISWIALKMEKISFSNGIQSVIFILFSSTILESPYWYTSWIIILFLLSVVFDKLRTVDENDFGERRNATLALITSLSFAAVMMITERMEIPYEIDALSGAKIEFIVFGLITHFMFFKTKNIEMDLGEFLWILRDKSDSKWEFDSGVNAWVLKANSNDADTDNVPKWGEMSRFTLAFSIFAICVGISTINVDLFGQKYLFPLLMILPISLLLHQLTSLKELSSATRFVGVLHLIIVATFTRPLMDNVVEFSTGSQSLIAGIIHDLILISAPFYVNYVIANRGLDRENLNRLADNLMFAGLTFLACFDMSGGLLFFSLFGLVAIQSLKFRMGIVNFVPIAFIFTYDFGTFAADYGISYTILDTITENPESYFGSKILWFTKFTGMITSIFMIFVLGVSFNDINNEDIEIKMSWVAPLIWFFFAALAALPDASWLPLIIVTFGIVNAWYRGEMKYMQLLSLGLIVSWIIGFSEGLDELDGRIFGISMLFSGLSIAVMTILASSGFLMKHLTDYGSLSEGEYIEKLHNELKFFSLVPLMLSFDVFLGIGMLIASLWATVEVFRVGDKTSLLLLPLLHGLTLGNILYQADLFTENGRGYIVGSLLVIEGIALLNSSGKDDMIYDSNVFNWQSDEQFFQYIERLGIAGTISSISGVGYAFNSDIQMAFMILTLILIGLAITGFNEKYYNVRWRRALGVYGSMITGICFYGTVETDLYASLTIVGLGLLALGYGFIYLQASSNFIAPNQPHEEVVLEAIVPESDAEEEDDSESIEEIDQEDVDEAEEIEVDEFAELEQELSDESDEQVIDIPPPVVEEENNIVKTYNGIDIRFPSGVLDNITKTIQLTPHDGFVPILEIGENGKLRLVFDPSPE